MGLNNKFIITMPVWNAGRLVEKAILSVLKQDFDDVGLIIRNDVSTDGTGKIIKDFIGIDGTTTQSTRMMNVDIIYIHNDEKLYAPGNVYESVLNYVKNDDAVIGVVDGDDILVRDDVLSIVHDVYEKMNKWVVWTQYKPSAGKIGHCKMIPENYKGARRHWVSSHFRTAKAFLYKKIKKEDLMKDDTYFKRAGDLGLMYPLIEMAGYDRCYFLNTVCYQYNNTLPTNDHALGLSEQVEIAGYIQSLPVYEELP